MILSDRRRLRPPLNCRASGFVQSALVIPKKLRQYDSGDVAFRHTFVVERDRRRFRTPRKKPARVSEMIEVVRSPSTICNSKPRRAGATTGSANALGII